ncbi:MAG: gephyrin-like molybdotransferase Glp [Pseudomonadota bacterium]
MNRYDIGLEEALSMTLGSLKCLSPVVLPVDKISGLVAAEDIFAVTDCPSATSSLKDGYAVVSKDIQGASETRPVRLRVAGVSVAGDDTERDVEQGSAVKVLTGALLPKDADAVISVEFTREEGDFILCYRNARPGRNVLYRGTDVVAGECVVSKGQMFTPALTGLLAAGGIHEVRVFPMPRVAIIATGDEVVAPGRPIKAGQVYASNLVTLSSWLRYFGMQVKSAVVRDHPEDIRSALTSMLSDADVLLTSGGAWKSERDFTVKILDEMGWEMVFHRVRIGPGKAVALGMIHHKPVFCLPGGPPSNEMAFLQLTLPGLLQIAGRAPVPFKVKKVRLAATVGGDPTWTQLFQATLEKRENEWWAVPQLMKSRLQSQARAEALIKVPEGMDRLAAGDMIEVQVLSGGKL